MRASTVISFLALRAFEAIVVLLLIIFMPSVPPVCKIWDSYSVQPSKPLEGSLAINDKLNNVEIWHKGDVAGPEAFASYEGELYASLGNGDVVKMSGSHVTPIVKFGKPCKGFFQEKICGRPLGLQFDKDGSLVVVDAYYGMFRVNVKTGDKTQIVSNEVEIDGLVPKLMNSLAIASNGDIYWTDSSTEFALEDGLIDMFADGSGRLIHYDIKTKTNTVLLNNLHFANGVHLSDDEEFLLVAETARNRVLRYYIKGPKKNTSDIFIDGLPGLPDNINSDGQGGFFVPLIVAVDEDFPLAPQIIGPFPLIRKFVARMFGLSELGFKVLQQIYPNDYAEMAIHFIGHFSSFSFIMPRRVTVLHVSKTGEILDSMHSTNKKIASISEAFIFKDQLYLGSPFNDYIARISLKDAGLAYLIKKDAPKRETLPPATKQTPPPTQAPTIKATQPTQKPKESQPPTRAPTVTVTQPTQKPKETEPPTQAPKTTAPPTQPTQQPKKIPQPTELPKKTPQPTQAPSKPTPTPTEIPPIKKTESPTIKPTEAPKIVPKTTPPPIKEKTKVETPREETQNKQPAKDAKPKQTSPSQLDKDQSKEVPVKNN